MLRITEVKWYSDVQFGFISFLAQKSHSLGSIQYISVLFDGHRNLHNGCYARFFILNKQQNFCDDIRNSKSNLIETI